MCNVCDSTVPAIEPELWQYRVVIRLMSHDAHEFRKVPTESVRLATLDSAEAFREWMELHREFMVDETLYRAVRFEQRDHTGIGSWEIDVVRWNARRRDASFVVDFPLPVKP